MDQDIIVRHIREEELDELLSLYAHLHLKDDPFPPMPDLVVLWHDITLNPLLHYFVTEYKGEIVASCCLVIVPNLTHGARPFGLIENVVTHSDYRRKGCATALLKHALDFAWTADCHKVMLLSGVDRTEAHSVYEGLGFNRYSKIGYEAKP